MAVAIEWPFRGAISTPIAEVSPPVAALRKASSSLPKSRIYVDMTILTLVLALQAVDIKADDPTYRAVVQMDNV